MRVSTIDVGTNTVRLLVADVVGPESWTIVEAHQTVTRLGEGLAAAGALGEAPMARTLAVVRDYVARAERLTAARVRLVATSAVRDAANGSAFVDAVERATGRRVEVVSGEEEARLMLRGVRSGLRGLAGTIVTFDIGGGSTEYILAENERVSAAVSVRLGVVALAERFPFADGVDWGRYAVLLAEVRARLERELPQDIRSARVAYLLGTGGTVTTLAALDLDLVEYEPRRVQGHRLSRATVERLLRRLGGLSLAARAALPGLEPGRADLIIPGIAIVTATLDTLGLATLVVSDWGLREGILADALEGRHEPPPDAAP